MLTILSTLVAIGALYYAWKQTQLANRLAAKQEEQQREVYDWLVRHENVARIVSKQPPHCLFRIPGTGERVLYTTVFSDPEFRKDIEQHIVDYTVARTLFVPRKPTELQLRSPALRETVIKVEKILEDCKQNQPELYKHYA